MSRVHAVYAGCWLTAATSPLAAHEGIHLSQESEACSVFAGAQTSLTGMAVKKLQQVLPDACVVYSSATGASGTALLASRACLGNSATSGLSLVLCAEPSNLAYMIRLGTSGFPNMQGMIRYLTGCTPGCLLACAVQSCSAAK